MFVSPEFEHTFYQSLNSPTCQFLALTQELSLLVYRLTLAPRFRLNKATGVIPLPSNPSAFCLFPGQKPAKLRL
jgi:hypothetical protein